MAAVQRTLLGGERVAAVWLHDAQVQKHVSHANCSRLLYVQYIRQRSEYVAVTDERCACLSVRVDGKFVCQIGLGLYI